MQHSEESPLLGETERPTQRRTAWSKFWRPRPLWILPVIILGNACRGLTMAPRIEVYNQLACWNIYPDTDKVLEIFTGVRTEVDAWRIAPKDSLPEICIGDLRVQAGAAHIQAAVATTGSVLSALTTGYWSGWSDRHGRTKLLGLAIAGMVFMDLVFILVSWRGTWFQRYGSSLVVVAPLVDGFLGGLSTFNAGWHAYTTDCTPQGSRSNIFSRLHGIMFLGLAFGPELGGFYIHRTGYPAASTQFWMSVAIGVFNLVYSTLMLPEPSRQSHIRPVSEYRAGHNVQSLTHNVKKFIRHALAPVLLLIPMKRTSGRRDFNMTFLGLSFFFYIMFIGTVQFRYMYAKHIYRWTTAQLGYYMSVLWALKAAHLLVILPTILYLLKPRRSPTEVVVTPAAATDPVGPSMSAEMKFDQRIAWISLLIDFLANLLVIAAPIKSEELFILSTSLSSFTSGANPAINSLGAVCMHAAGKSNEIGLLFGALAVLNALAHSVSPTFSATVYAATLGSYPRAIFVLGAAYIMTVIVFLLLINPRNASGDTSPAVSRNVSRRQSRRNTIVYQPETVEAPPPTSGDPESPEQSATASVVSSTVLEEDSEDVSKSASEVHSRSRSGIEVSEHQW